MKSLQIAILGGCLNSGYGLVGINQLYHRVMARELERKHGCTIRVTLGRLNTHEHAGMIECAARMVEKSKPDVLFFQIRPDFLWGLCSALWLSRQGYGLSRLRRNPHSKHGAHWPEALESSICPMHRFASLNYQLARTCGLHEKALASLEARLDDLRNMSQQQHFSLGIISPIFGTYYPACIQQFAHEKVMPLLQGSGLPIMDLTSCDRLRDSNQWADHFHLNATGHQVAADIAINTIERMLPRLV